MASAPLRGRMGMLVLQGFQSLVLGENRGIWQGKVTRRERASNRKVTKNKQVRYVVYFAEQNVSPMQFDSVRLHVKYTKSMMDSLRKNNLRNKIK